MKSNDCIIAFRPDEENRCYLTRLGVIDGRTSKIRKEGPNIAKILNNALKKFLSCDDVSKLTNGLTSDDIREFWVKYQVAELNKRIEQDKADIIKLSKQLHKEQAYEEANKILEKQVR